MATQALVLVIDIGVGYFFDTSNRVLRNSFALADDNPVGAVKEQVVGRFLPNQLDQVFFQLASLGVNLWTILPKSAKE